MEQREIKFRGWNEEKKIMVYDNEDDTCEYWDGVKASNLGLINHRLKDSDYIFMQYTGLKDKNGKEIFEGDLIKHGEGDIIAEIVWQDGCLLVHRIYQNSIDVSNSNLTQLDNDFCTFREIIGNIYENADLLA